jgi:hypothetical protein
VPSARVAGQPSALYATSASGAASTVLCICTRPAIIGYVRFLQVLQDNLPRYTPPQLAALLACHSRLGLDTYAKLLRKTAAEYLRRPVPAAAAELLLGVLSGLAAGGSATVKELPPQLLAK